MISSFNEVQTGKYSKHFGLVHFFKVCGSIYNTETYIHTTVIRIGIGNF